MGSSLTRQLGFYPRAFGILAAAMLVLALLPGMPKIPFLSLAAICGFLAFQLKKKNLDATRFSELLDQASDSVGDSSTPRPVTVDAANPNSGSVSAGQTGDAAGEPSAPANEDLRKLVDVDLFTVELGYSLLRLADEAKGR